LAVLAALSVYALASKVEQSSDKPQKKTDPATGAMLASALVPIATNLLQGLLGALFKPSDYQDVSFSFAYQFKT
jgi:hypothetical protein